MRIIEELLQAGVQVFGMEKGKRGRRIQGLAGLTCDAVAVTITAVTSPTCYPPYLVCVGRTYTVYPAMPV